MSEWRKFYSNFETGTWAVVAVDDDGYILPYVPVAADDVTGEVADVVVSALNQSPMRLIDHIEQQRQRAELAERQIRTAHAVIDANISVALSTGQRGWFESLRDLKDGLSPFTEARTVQQQRQVERTADKERP